VRTCAGASGLAALVIHHNSTILLVFRAKFPGEILLTSVSHLTLKRHRLDCERL
jgi:hypothetical protein